MSGHGAHVTRMRPIFGRRNADAFIIAAHIKPCKARLSAMFARSKAPQHETQQGRKKTGACGSRTPSMLPRSYLLGMAISTA